MDRGQLWSFCRDVLRVGAAIERAEKDSNYELYSARLDRTASQYAGHLETLLKSQTPCEPAPPSTSPSTTPPVEEPGQSAESCGGTEPR